MGWCRSAFSMRDLDKENEIILTTYEPPITSTIPCATRYGAASGLYVVGHTIAVRSRIPTPVVWKSQVCVVLIAKFPPTVII